MRNVQECLEEHQEHLKQQAEYIRQVDNNLIDLCECLIQVSQCKFGGVDVINSCCCSSRTGQGTTRVIVHMWPHLVKKDQVCGCHRVLVCNWLSPHNRSSAHRPEGNPIP